jgi:hypothetical protein
MKLGEAIRLMLCDVAQVFEPSLPARLCDCEEPQLQEYGCAYGSCRYLRCVKCGRIYRVLYYDRKCGFPYSK